MLSCVPVQLCETVLGGYYILGVTIRDFRMTKPTFEMLCIEIVPLVGVFFSSFFYFLHTKGFIYSLCECLFITLS